MSLDYALSIILFLDFKPRIILIFVFNSFEKNLIISVFALLFSGSAFTASTISFLFYFKISVFPELGFTFNFIGNCIIVVDKFFQQGLNQVCKNIACHFLLC